jgi:hypothetical protein
MEIVTLETVKIWVREISPKIVARKKVTDPSLSWTNDPTIVHTA